MINQLTKLLNIKYPILQGPLGGGLSSAKLVAAVSNTGGLGGYGAYQLEPEQIRDIVKEIRILTDKPFNINLWVNDVDEKQEANCDNQFIKVVELFKPYFAELGIPLPQKPVLSHTKFEKQADILLSCKPAVFSFVFGIPSVKILKEFRKQRIKIIGTATTLDEACALEEANVDIIVASGFEAGGHRPSFLKPPENSLHGTFSLIQQLSSKIKKPIIAAGGIVDTKGINASFALGAVGVQIGTAFLACNESGASDEYRNVLFSGKARYTTLTKAFTGRLARGTSGIISENHNCFGDILPFPLQTKFMSPLREAAIKQDKIRMLTFWAGQNASLIKHRSVKSLMNELTSASVFC